MINIYSIKNADKIEREKMITEALERSILVGKEPPRETMNLVQTYVDGEFELSTILEPTINNISNPWIIHDSSLII